MPASSSSSSAAPVENDVRTHFRIPIPSGKSTFTVRVPHHHLAGGHHRRFFFSQLHLTPDYFSLEAEKMKLDADPELDKMIDIDVRLKITFPVIKTAHMEEPYTHGGSINETVAAIAAINAYFESKKPTYMDKTPLFFDWTDATLGKEADIQASIGKLPNLFYGEAIDNGKHFDQLPASVRGMEGVNNYLLPIGSMASNEAYAERIRLRMWLAPFTRAIFSSPFPFANDWGFTPNQLGKLQHKQYHLVNDTPYYIPAMIAKAAPNATFTKLDFKIYAAASSTPIEGSLKKIRMVKRDWYNNAKLTETLTEMFKQMSRSTNIDFSFHYDATAKQFSFKFPESDSLTIQVLCEPEFAHRLGYGLTNIIAKGMQADPLEDRDSIQDALKKALTVVYDTGPIVCTLDQFSSNTTSGTLDYTMAALYPLDSGTLSMPQSVCSCSADAVPITPCANASGAFVPITFRLLRIYEDQSISDFSWKCNAYIYGVLQGTCKKV